MRASSTCNCRCDRGLADAALTHRHDHTLTLGCQNRDQIRQRTGAVEGWLIRASGRSGLPDSPAANCSQGSHPNQSCWHKWDFDLSELAKSRRHGGNCRRSPTL